ncbi:MAG: hypothetical protein ACRDOB_18600 [Streptosporangiaceae bacterium]
MRLLTTRTGKARPGSERTWEPLEWDDPDPSDEAYGYGPDGTWVFAPESAPPPRRARGTRAAVRPPSSRAGQMTRRGRRRLIPLWVKWSAALALTALIFRKALAFAVIATLSAGLHLIGLNLHLPDVKLTWPWQSVTAGVTTDTDVGPWVLQKIEGISRPALGSETFNFVFTHKVSKNIGFWPCWYSSTFAAVGRASATVDLNPGPAWWTPASGHYRLQVLNRPVAGQPGRVAVSIVLPQPQLPQTVHDIAVDNTLSHPIDTQHSWTYPGFGCGTLLKPQFSVSVLYAQAQNLAFYQATHNPRVSRPLISAAEAEATQIIRGNFVQPTLNALGYTLASFSLRWSGAP